MHDMKFWSGLIALGDSNKKKNDKPLFALGMSLPLISFSLAVFCTLPNQYFPHATRCGLRVSEEARCQNLESTPEQKARYQALLVSQVEVDPSVVNHVLTSCAKREQLLITYPKAPLMITL